MTQFLAQNKHGRPNMDEIEQRLTVPSDDVATTKEETYQAISEGKAVLSFMFISRIVRDARLKIKWYRFGTVTHTKVALMYFEGVTNRRYIDEIKLEFGKHQGEFHH